MRKVLLGAAVLVSATVFSAPAMAAGFTNGDFETGSLSSWTATGNLAAYSNTGIPVPADWGTTRVAAIGVATLSQTFDTVANTVYKIGYTIESDGGPGSVAVDFGGTTNTGGTTVAGDTFTSHFFYATATGATTTLNFGLNNNSYFNLDNITVTAVPEAGTWAMLLIGFGAAGVTMRSRRRAAKVTYA
jgi:hypothetical protein|uniref:PEP-CTERM sorting domain-containing protein n=1 Tax=uncultured Sphingomonas sp. TaxID=158754 RepID=UPI0035CA515C